MTNGASENKQGQSHATGSLSSSGISATSIETLSNSFLGVPVEICIATRSIDKTMKAMTALGVGPWGVYEFNENTVADRRSYGKPDPYVINVAFAQNGPIVWELMEPVQGAETLQRALADREEMIHHVSFDGSDLPMSERVAELERRGATPALSGVWLGQVPFHFLESPGLGAIVLETYVFPPDFLPEPDRWYPAPPPGRGG